METIHRDAYDRVLVGRAANGAPYAGAGGPFVIVSNRLENTGTGSFDAYHVADYGSGDVIVDVTINNAPGGNNAGIIVRYSDASNYWRLTFDSVNADNMVLQKRVAGAFSTPGDYFGLSKSVPAKLRLVAAGPVFTAYLAGVKIGTVVDSFNRNARKHGVYAALTTGGFDDLTVRVPDGRAGRVGRGPVRGRRIGVA